MGFEKYNTQICVQCGHYHWRHLWLGNWKEVDTWTIDIINGTMQRCIAYCDSEIAGDMCGCRYITNYILGDMHDDAFEKGFGG